MNIEEVRDYALSLPGVTEDSPYGPDMIVFRIEQKIFLHMPLEYADPRVSVKLPPEEGQSLREHTDGIRPAYHLNKTHWNDIYLDIIDGDEVKKLIHESYMLVLSKLPKKLRMKYERKNT
jgi:predicted DNA-binding protein (MmcQ/YjbR family)